MLRKCHLCDNKAINLDITQECKNVSIQKKETIEEKLNNAPYLSSIATLSSNNSDAERD